ncbi:MAG: GH32 C-terminal domain-containing protein [Planctomycetota bacterium]|nr:GH32 C-terminal domain-containing protein [Planctomycetota bacterium]
MRTRLVALFLAASAAAYGPRPMAAAVPATADKTLVAWVAPANVTQQGGSALTIQSGDQFDAVVLGERARGKWMAGSEFFRRTQGDQNANAVETVGPDTPVQMAIVYQGEEVRLYRNGQPYAAYKTQNVELLGANNHIAVFGLRHVGATSGTPLAGSIDDARIYGRALTSKEIQSLKPNQPSDNQPLAWWDFEGDVVKDRAGHFTHHALAGGAKLQGGRLVLDGTGCLIAARSEADAKQTAHRISPPAGPFVPETPAMPAVPPRTWLTYHLAHPGPGGAIPADPNPAFYYKGRYHLHYIYNHKDGCAFAHVSSTDMVHWKWHPTTLTPKTTGHGMFSGTGFFTKDGAPAMIYHGQGSSRNQIAFALDDNLEKWSKPVAIEPKTEDGGLPAMRHWDPDCWLMDGSYYALSGGGNPKLIKSQDLNQWVYVGELFHEAFPANLGVAKAEDVSCPNIFKIGDKWMLLCISHALGARYYLGDFNGEKYLPTHHAMLNWARWDFFAPESLLTKDGRRVMWAWCTPWINGMQKTDRAKNFEKLLNPAVCQQGIQSLPRELSLPPDGVLRIKPLAELAQLRQDAQSESNITVSSDSVRVLDGIQGDALELEVVIAAPKAKEFGVKVLCDAQGENGLTIASGAGSKVLTVGYVQPPFELRENEDLTLRIFVDKSMVEVFANDRQAAVAWHDYSPERLHVSLFSKGGDVTVRSVRAWRMNSIYPAAPPSTITYEPADAAGPKKHVVLLCGEWEYRCEESLTMLAKILAKRHGFKCTVLFQMNPQDGTVDPSVRNNIPGMDVLKEADMLIVFAMDLTLPDHQMKPFVEFLETGKPVLGVRCSLLSFRYPPDSPYARFDVGNGGYARDLFGESWRGHYGAHGKESTRGLVAEKNAAHPILRGVRDVWGPTDVYRINQLPNDANTLMYGQVLTGMQPTDPPNTEKSTMPMVWTREIKRASGNVSRVVFSTIGAAQDMESEDLRRLYVNSVYWALGLESHIPPKADVSCVGGDWKASPFGGGKFHRGLKPADFAIPDPGVKCSVR